MTFQRLVRDEKTAILYSKGSGAGWSTWNEEVGEGLIFDREIVEAVLADDRATAMKIAEKKYPGIYAGGGYDLAVEWVPRGARFYIEEYDGSETVTIIGPDFGYVA